MATGKQGHNQGRNQGDTAGEQQGQGQAPTGTREQLREAGQHVRDQAQQFSQHVREGFDSSRESAAHQFRQAEGLMARNPSESVLIGFGVGVGLGVLLAIALTKKEESTWYERNAPDALRDLPDRLRDLPERITSEIARHLPKAMHMR